MTLSTKKRTKTTSLMPTSMQEPLQKTRLRRTIYALRLPRRHSSKLVRL